MELTQLLFEFSHPVRLQMLRALAKSPDRMTEIARLADASAPETSRHLERLMAANLVQRTSGGSYEATPFGQLVLSLLSSLDFVAEHADDFRRYDLRDMPGPFLERLGELKGCKKVEGLMTALDEAWRIYRESAEWLSIVTPEPPLKSLPRLGKSSTIRLRLVVEPTYQHPFPLTVEQRAKHFRVVPRIPLALAVSEAEAGLGFRSVSGKWEYDAIYLSKEEAFRNWCTELFEWYWSRGDYLR